MCCALGKVHFPTPIKKPRELLDALLNEDHKKIQRFSKQSKGLQVLNDFFWSIKLLNVYSCQPLKYKDKSITISTFCCPLMCLNVCEFIVDYAE